MGAGLEDAASPGQTAAMPHGSPASPRRLRDLPFVRVFARPATWGVLAAIAVAVALAWTALAWRTDLLDPTSTTGDPWNYLAAAERLRDGRPLYSIGPGDRPVVGYPGDYPIPLLAPPTVAVLVLPLAYLPSDVAMALWALGGFVVTIATVGWAIIRGGIAVRVLVLILAYPIATSALSGNVNAYLLPILLWTWLGVVPGRGALGGVATGIAAAARIGPAFVGVLYVVRRRWAAALAAAATLGGAVTVSVAVAGLEAWRVYVEITFRGAIEPTGLSVPGMLDSMGLGPPFTSASIVGVWVAAAATIWLLRARPRFAFVVAIVAAIYATPVVRMESWALLLSAAAPWLIDGAGPREECTAGDRPAGAVRRDSTLCHLTQR